MNGKFYEIAGHVRQRGHAVREAKYGRVVIHGRAARYLGQELEPDMQHMVGGAGADEPLEASRLGPAGRICRLNLPPEQAFWVRRKLCAAKKLLRPNDKIPHLPVRAKKILALESKSKYLLQR